MTREALLLGLLGVMCCLAAGSAFESAPDGPPPRVDTYRMIQAYPHDQSAFTQGLIFHDGFLFESTGIGGRSTLRKVRLETGEVIQQYRLEEAHFAEGLTEWNGELVQLTWRSKTAFFYDLETFLLNRTVVDVRDGWGITHDQARFIVSDGTQQLRFLLPDTFREVRTITVSDSGVPVPYLNELEYIRGEVFANVWHTDRIARISPESGRVLGWIDLEGLMPTRDRRDSEAVLNGIAYDATSNRLFVTGKLWPRLFEVEVVSRSK